MGRRKKTDPFSVAVDAAKAQVDRGPQVLHDVILTNLGLDLGAKDLQEVVGRLEREGIAPGQLSALPPWHIDALDDKFGWSHRFDTR